MSGGDPPLPPSRPPYHSWHGRPSHRRRGGPSGITRNGWVGRRPRSPPLPPPRPRHLRPFYKHHRHVPQTPPSASQSQHHPSGYHPLGPPPPLSRSLAGRLRTPPRSPLRHSDLPSHRVESLPYRGEPGPSHRVEPPEHLSFRGLDPPPFRPPPPKSRGDSYSFSSERPSLRGPSDHPPPYRGEPGPLYRADSVPHRDEFEPRRGLGGVGGGGSGDGLSSRGDSSSYYAPWFRQPGKIHKPLKPKKRRPPPHIPGALRSSGPYLSKPQSPILSRMGLPLGDRGTSGPRIGMGSTSGPGRKGLGPSLSSPKDLSSTSNRSNAHDSHVFGPAKQRRSLPSPRQQQSLRSISSPDERTNNDRQKLQPNGPVRVDSEKRENRFPNGAEKRPRPSHPQRHTEAKSTKEETTSDRTAECNGTDWSHTNGPSNASKGTPESETKPAGAVSSAATSEVGTKEANGLKLDALPKSDVATKPSEQKPIPKAENGPIEAKKETEPAKESEARPKLRPESPLPQATSSSHDEVKGDRLKSDTLKKDERSTLDSQPRIPHLEEKLNESTTKVTPSGLQSEYAPSTPKPSRSFESSPISQPDQQSDAVPSAGRPKESSSAPPLSVPEAPVSVPAPAISLLRSTPRARTRSSSFEGKLGSLSSFGQISVSTAPPSPAADFLRGSSPKTGVASNDLVRQIHEVEGKITAIERTIGELKNSPPKKSAILTAPTSETKSKESDTERYAALAQEVAAKGEARIAGKPPKRSRHLLHAAGRCILVRNQSVAAASHAELRAFCSDVELGLDAVTEDTKLIGGELSPVLISKVAQYLRRKKANDFARRRKIGKEYSMLTRLWHEKLSTAREGITKEKRDALRERDRYILLCTKGTSALLTSRTSSGRTSTKVVPPVGANGQINGTAELDQLLTDIDAEGGTPGSKLIWSKTLADIPDQDASRPPLDCFSVLMTDPVAEHHASRAVNPWRFEEVLVFLDKYLTCSKNFMKIASFLEHKSPRDCSYFYYMNKLRLGLKQLTKDASAMKRRGTLRRHIIQLAKQFAFLDPNQQAADSFHVSVQNSVAVSAAEKFMTTGDVRACGFLGVASNRQGYSIERRESRELPLKRSEKILSDAKAIDLSGIDRRPFAQAMAAHGTDWKAIRSYLGLPGKTSTHYREFFRRNKRKLEAEDIREHSRTRFLLSSRNANSGAKLSPRMSPRSSPRHTGPGNRSKLSDLHEVESPELMQLDDTDNDEVATRIMLKDGKETIEDQAKEEVSRPRYEAEAPVRATNKNEREVKKGRPTATWTADECVQFRVLFKQHGRDWKTIARLMAPKTPTQIKGYWTTVAHEVGDGLTGDGTRSRSERKRMRRRTSSETLSRQSPTVSQSDIRASPKARSPPSKDDEEVMGEPNGQSLSERAGVNGPGEENSAGKKDGTGAVSKEATDSTKFDSEAQGGTPTEIATSEERGDVSRSRLPMLRSLPIPVLRSVPLSSGKSKSSTFGQTKDGKTSNGDELRNVAESCGVLELLGNEAGNGDGKPRSE